MMELLQCLLSKQKGVQEVVCCNVCRNAATSVVMSCLYQHQQTAACCKQAKASFQCSVNGIHLRCFLKGQQSCVHVHSEAHVVQAWGLLEAEGGNVGKARELLEKGSQIDPWHVPVWQAWGVLEFRSGNIDRARALFQEVSVAVV